MNQCVCGNITDQGICEDCRQAIHMAAQHRANELPDFSGLTDTGVTMLSAMRTIQELQDEATDLKARIHFLNEDLLNAKAEIDNLKALNRSLEADCHYLRGDHM